MLPGKTEPTSPPIEYHWTSPISGEVESLVLSSCKEL